MKPVSPVFPGIDFPEIKIAEHQPEYQTLPVVDFGNSCIVSRWAMDELEKKTVENTGIVYICLLTFGGEPPATCFWVRTLIESADSTDYEKFMDQNGYVGRKLPVIAKSDEGIWMQLQLSDPDREIVAREGNVYFFMDTGGKLVTPQLIQVDNPLGQVALSE